MGGFAIEGFALGLSTGVYCLTACAPVLVPYMLSDARPGWRGNARLLAEFLAGRLAAYLLVGLAAGLGGQTLAGRAPAWLLSAAVMASGLVLLLSLALKAWPHASWCAAAGASAWWRRAPLALGFTVGINVCPPFVAGVVRAAGLGAWWAGPAYFAAFFAGTSLYMLPALAVVPFVSMERMRRIGTLACGLAGLWLAGTGAAGILAALR